MMRTVTCLGVFALSLIIAPSAGAAPCAGFPDVDDTSQFCPNVEWLKNRQVTLGCGTGGYCPNDPVTRLSMSAFLQRLGVALIPFTLGQVDLPGAIGPTLANATVVCGGIVNQMAPASYARTARGHATFMFKSSGSADVAVEIVESTDGTNWTTASPAQTASADDQKWATVAVLLPPRPLAPNLDYQYGLRITRKAGSATTGNPSEHRCRYKIYADNRNPATSPFDD
jgi:hypothetical protein